jgi:hypothetical protein
MLAKRRANVISKPTSVNELPTEMWKILSYLGPEVLGLIPEVCKQWNELTKDVTLWKTLPYCCGRTADSRVEQVLTVEPALHTLF